MGRALTIPQSEFPYNITARCINKEWFRLSMDHVWNIFSEELYVTAKIYNLKIHSFVLMRNHFHLIASTPDSNISQCLHRLMGCASRRLNEDGNRINGNFSGRHFKTILNHSSYYLNAYKYNYLNPVVAGVSQRVEEYKYSTLNGLLGYSQMIIPVVNDFTLFEDVDSNIEWLNTMPSPDHYEAVRYALKRRFFKSKKETSGNRLVLEVGETI